MTDSQAPTQQVTTTYRGTCKACNKDIRRPKYKELNKASKGIYVRCNCGQINRCFE